MKISCWHVVATELAPIKCTGEIKRIGSCSVEQSMSAPQVVPSTRMVGAVLSRKWTPKSLELLAALILLEFMKHVGKQDRPTLPSRLKPDIRNRVKLDSKKEYGVHGAPVVA